MLDAKPGVERRDDGRGRRGAPFPAVERGSAERLAPGSAGVKFLEYWEKEDDRQEEALFVGHGPADRPMSEDHAATRLADNPCR